MAATPRHSSDNSSMIDMSDIQTALEMVKDGSRADSSTSLVSLASHGTSAPTPPSTSPQQPSSGDSAPCCGSSARRSSGGFREDEGASSDRRPAVRWSDECGLDLVTQVQTTPDFWDELVFGHERCTCTVSDNNGSGSTTTTTTIKTGCECEGCDGDGERQPGELFQFIEELSRGVEATLLFPSMIGGITKKRRPVILYTEDNGESICWINTGAAATAAGSKEPYRIRCKTLVAVKDKSGFGRCAGGGSIADLEESGTSTDGPTSIGWWTSRGGNRDPSRGHSRLSDSTDEGDGCGAAGGESGKPGVRIKLKWLPQPTWSKRTVKIADVKTRCPGIFTRGMVQLLSFNTDIQR